MEDGEWVPWSDSVPKTQLEPHRIVSSDMVITTTDTVRYISYIYCTIEHDFELLILYSDA